MEGEERGGKEGTATEGREGEGTGVEGEGKGGEEERKRKGRPPIISHTPSFDFLEICLPHNVKISNCSETRLFALIFNNIVSVNEEITTTDDRRSRVASETV